MGKGMNMQSNHKRYRVEGWAGAKWAGAQWSGAGLFLCLLAAGCTARSVSLAVPPPEVRVAPVVVQDIPVVMEFAGTVKSVRSVDVIPRVSGHIDSMHFKEGTSVQEGDLLYVIDPRPYQAKLASLEAILKEHQAAVAFWKNEVERYTRLVEAQAGSVEDKQKAISRQDEVKAQLEEDTANIDNAKLDLSFTRITAPFTGRIQETQIYPGALVEQQRDVLTTLIQIDPIYVVFNISRREVGIIQQLQTKNLAPKELQEYRTVVFLPDGDQYEREGHLEYFSVQIDPTTDTLQARAVFPNAEKDKSQTRLIPGQYVPIHLTAGHRPDALLIPQTALIQSQVGTQVLVVDDDSKAQLRTVEVDRAHDKQWVIRKGLKKGERVIVEGLQKVRSGNVVKVGDNASSGNSDR
jgi:RND family efflux transporter MFP subunit